MAQAIPQETVPVAGFDDDAARLYGILLGAGHCSEDGAEWSVGGDPGTGHLAFVQSYLEGAACISG